MTGSGGLVETRRADCVAMTVDKAMKKSRILHVGAILLLGLTGTGRGGEIRSLEDVLALQAKTEELGRKVLPAVVALISEEVGSSGSGVVVGKDGLILTAAHVIDGAEEVEVVFPGGKQAKGKVLGANFSKDIGMVRIVDEGDWPVVEIGESKPLQAGDWVVAMGHSEGYDPARTPPLRFGRVVSDGPGNFLTTDCTLIGGDSGGPLFDLEGRVVGINSSIGESLDNNNHAGIDGFREDWDRMLAGEIWGELQLNPLANPERPVLGILMGRELSNGGVPVERVTPDSPAAKAGIRPGDVVVAVDGTRIRGGRNLGMILAKHSAGDEVEVSLLRGREEVKLRVELMRQDQLFEKLER